MKISEVRIALVRPQAGLFAFATVVIDDQLLLTSIGVHRRQDGSGYRLTYPTRKSANKDSYLFRPLTPEVSALIERAIFEKMKTVMKSHDRYDCPDVGRERF